MVTPLLCVYVRYTRATKWRHWHIFNTRKDKFLARSSAVLIGLSPALGYLPFTSTGKFSYTTWVLRCPVSCASSAQILGEDQEYKCIKFLRIKRDLGTASRKSIDSHRYTPTSSLLTLLHSSQESKFYS